MKNKKPLTEKWLKIREIFEANTNDNISYGKNFPIEGELDQLVEHFIGYLSFYTIEMGYDAVIEGVKLDIWKERIWTLCEKAGLLPEID
jgi:hypothetical protein